MTKKTVYIENPVAVKALVANNNIGVPGQFLASNGSGIYWGTGVGYTGSIGYTGSRGDTGYVGSASTAVGYTGSRGIIGYTGSQGVIGYTGSQGNIGYTGSQGINGYTGSQGIQGIQGFTGSKGDQGNIGYTGSKGDQGLIGYTGSQGPQGINGYTGSQGPQGVIGYTGSQGSQGINGYTGSQGTQGVIGYTGSKGDQGVIGYTGSQGPTVYPGAGIAVSTGSSWNTSKTAPAGDIVGTSDTQTLTNKTLTSPILNASRSAVTAVAASNIDCSVGSYFTKTASGALSWTVTNVPATGAFSFILELTNGGTGTQTWFTGTKWPGGTAPTLTTSGVDVLGFITDDGGTTWRGVQLMKDSK